MKRKLILDANILVRAVLGSKITQLLEQHASTHQFLASEEAFLDARKHSMRVLEKHGVPDPSPFLETLEQLEILVTSVPLEVYSSLEETARQRLQGRDEDDWHFVALALLLDTPLLTEDKDLFGTGVSTWTIQNIAIYFELGI